MGFERDRLPDPATYFEGEGLTLTGPRSAKWKTAACTFHGGSDSMRINTVTGAWVCMAGCGARGGDVLAYHQATHGLEFVEAAKALGAWVDDGKPQAPHRPTPLSPRPMPSNPAALPASSHAAHPGSRLSSARAGSRPMTSEKRRQKWSSSAAQATMPPAFAG